MPIKLVKNGRPILTNCNNRGNKNLPEVAIIINNAKTKIEIIINL